MAVVKLCVFEMRGPFAFNKLSGYSVKTVRVRGWFKNKAVTQRL